MSFGRAIGRATVLSLASAGLAATGAEPQASLANTSWRRVKFQGGDDKTLRPDDRSTYTIAFRGDGRVSRRIDCSQ